MSPLVSVAIITYNQKIFLMECIESCLAQDYNNFEIVIADDCSTDGTRELLLDYKSKYPNKFVLKFSETNRGVTVNSNAAHFSCSGKYICWLGGDDLMLPKKISKQVEFMEANSDCTICYHDLDVFQSDTGDFLYSYSEKNKPRQGDVRTSIKFGTFNGACSTMIRRDKCPVSGFSTLIPIASDWLYWVECLANGGSIRYINETLGRYRRHDNNITKSSSCIGQNKIDHLNSCNYILSKYPCYFREASYAHAINIRSMRRNLPYLPSLLYCFKVSFDFKSLVGIFAYIASFGALKL